MNRLNSYLVILSVFFLIKCNSIEVALEVKEAEQPVIINYNKKNNIIYGIKIPFQLIVINKSNIVSKEFITIDYDYTPYNKGKGEEIFIEENGIIKILNNKKKVILPSETKKYIVYSRYRIDRIEEKEVFKEKMNNYLKKISKENKDTLHIGSVCEFKKKHEELFEKLTKNDSISIQFLNDGKLGEQITVPVQW